MSAQAGFLSVPIRHRVLLYWECIKLISQHGVPQTMWIMLESPGPCVFVPPPSLPVAQVRQAGLHVIFTCEDSFSCLFFHWGCRPSRLPIFYRGFSSALERTPKCVSSSPLYAKMETPSSHAPKAALRSDLAYFHTGPQLSLGPLGISLLILTAQ